MESTKNEDQLYIVIVKIKSVNSEGIRKFIYKWQNIEEYIVHAPWLAIFKSFQNSKVTAISRFPTNSCWVNEWWTWLVLELLLISIGKQGSNTWKLQLGDSTQHHLKRFWTLLHIQGSSELGFAVLGSRLDSLGYPRGGVVTWFPKVADTSGNYKWKPHLHPWQEPEKNTFMR